MERKIGEIFEYNGEWHQCVEGNGCENCAFKGRKCYLEGGTDDPIGECCCDRRRDNKNVIFKKLEKVGEPYEHYEKFYQCYKLPMETEIRLLPNNCYPIGKDKLVEIEIKQKEDMEEKEQCGDNRFEVIEKAKRHLLHSTNIESSKEEMKLLDVFLFRCWQMGWLDKYNDTNLSNSEKIGKNLRPFDLQAAQAGKPVCTRDGRKARIICFDRKGDQPIIALIEDNERDTETIGRYFENGHLLFENTEIKGDLMMLPEKKEGWVNIAKDPLSNDRVVLGRIFDSYEDAVKIRKSNERYIDTTKVNWEE